VKRQQRIIVNGLMVVSLLIFVATPLVWVRSYSISDCYYRRAVSMRDGIRVEKYLDLCVSRGVLAVHRAYVADSSDVWEAHNFAKSMFTSASGHVLYKNDRPAFPLAKEPFAIVAHEVLGFQWAMFKEPPEKGIRYYDHHSELLVLPLWAIFMGTGLLPVYQLLRWRSERSVTRHLQGLCVLCGYDLRGTPDRCPECGNVPEKAAGRS
jgi:hypothetical protein